MCPLEGLIWLSRTLKGNGVKLDAYQGDVEGSREAGKLLYWDRKNSSSCNCIPSNSREKKV